MPHWSQVAMLAALLLLCSPALLVAGSFLLLNLLGVSFMVMCVLVPTLGLYATSAVMGGFIGMVIRLFRLGIQGVHMVLGVGLGALNWRGGGGQVEGGRSSNRCKTVTA